MKLEYQQDKLVLLSSNFTPLFVDFAQASLKKGGEKLALIKACKPDKNIFILDATAGWGRDAAQLASFGAKVLMLERNPTMHALLADGLKRLADENSNLNLDLSLQQIDTKNYLTTLKPECYPDVIYIDPMHPVRSKTALVKKEMQVLQQLIGPDLDAQALITLALAHVKKRVVVKWPQRQSSLIPPTASINGKTVRFDIYNSIDNGKKSKTNH